MAVDVVDHVFNGGRQVIAPPRKKRDRPVARISGGPAGTGRSEDAAPKGSESRKTERQLEGQRQGGPACRGTGNSNVAS